MMKRVLLYLWQLPQNIAGVLLTAILAGRFNEFEGITFFYSPNISGGISLGEYIIVGRYDRDLLRHEYGHCIQSRILGWFYLPVVGIPSLVWAFLYGSFINPTPNGYYRFYTERWADELGGVKRWR
jgi:hypothetical protein